MAKKKSTLSRYKRKVATRKPKARPNPGPKPPPLGGIGTEIMHLALPALGGYAGTRLAGQIAYRVSMKKSPKLARHAAPIASTATAAAVYFLANKSEKLAMYHMPIFLGSSIAAAQNILQAYIPQWSWILNDVAGTAAPAKLAAKPAKGEVADAEAVGGYSDGDDAGDTDDIDALLDDGEGADDIYAGVFEGGYAH